MFSVCDGVYLNNLGYYKFVCQICGIYNVIYFLCYEDGFLVLSLIEFYIVSL